jgi:hypothetical protein
LQYRRYFSRHKFAPRGWYLSPHVSYAKADYNISLKDFDVKRILKTTNTNYNLLVGYQTMWGRRVVFDVFTGLGYRNIQTKIFDEQGTYISTVPNETPLKVSSGFNLGWAF